MQISYLKLTSLLAVLIASGLAQATEDPGSQPLPSVLGSWNGLGEATAEPIPQRLPSVDSLPQVEPSPHVVPSSQGSPSQGSPSQGSPSQVAPSPRIDPSPQGAPSQDTAPGSDVLDSGAPITIGGSEKLTPVSALSDFLGYRYSTSFLDWIPGGGDQFGMFSIVWDHYQKAGVNNGLGAGLGIHFLSGPDQTDMPARVYDFSLAYQFRRQLGPFAFDVAAAVLAASDFKGSARKGILFPSHAVGFLRVSPTVDVVLGVDYLDRGDIKLLPVAGMIWTASPDMRFELVFPRPRAVFQVADGYRVYLSGELGGGSWAVERVAEFNDLATYRDLRISIGLESDDKDGLRSSFEIGYLFDRRMLYSSGIGNMNLDDAVVFRLVTTF
jgi:hypothetical protein